MHRAATARELLPAQVAQSLHAWCELWGVSDLATRIHVQISSRMTRSLGRCYPERKLIRIAQFVAEGSDDLFQEVLCHEVAHLAAYELHGRSIRPHGREWKALMVMAGYEPHVKYQAVGLPKRDPVARRANRLASILEGLQLSLKIRRVSVAFKKPKRPASVTTSIRGKENHERC